MRKVALLLVFCCLAFYACKKWEDKTPQHDDRLNKPYCNDPQAVNYNSDFPGVPDNSICVYPVDAFRGEFLFYDSVFLGDNSFRFMSVYTIHIYALSNTKIALVGVCSPNDSIKLSAGKSYIATVDSSLNMPGQYYCRVLDTVIGTITKNTLTSTDSLKINFTVLSDTGITFHAGPAIKQ